ncbi:MAG: YbaK/EbsC family protein [Candidatus Sumerlaeia bacterium]
MLDFESHRVMKYLQQQKVDWKVIDHRPAPTTSLSARFAHVPGRMVMKPVLLTCDHQPLMLVLPATHRIDFDLFRQSRPCRSLQLASRDDLSRYFPDCMVDALPPFGHLYNIAMLVEQNLAENEFVCFHPGVDHILIEIPFNVYEQLVNPEFIVASVPARFTNAS